LYMVGTILYRVCNGGSLVICAEYEQRAQNTLYCITHRMYKRTGCYSYCIVRLLMYAFYHLWK
jgi:hypothetical protein